MPERIRIVIAAQSPRVREALSAAFTSDDAFDVCGVASSGAAAVELVKRLRPSVAAMGIALGNPNGFDTTKQIMIEAPTPIVIIADHDDVRQVEISIRALRAGALQVLSLPEEEGGAGPALRSFLSTIKALAEVKVVRHWPRGHLQKPAPSHLEAKPRKVRAIGIAASTGGPAALQRILSDLPADFPVPILVVQHIALGFIEGFVDWLQTVCSLVVKIATDGALLLPHTVYFAGDRAHMGIAGNSRIVLDDGAPIGGFKPSASFLFRSMADSFGEAGVGVMLTGMGQDGIEGLRALHVAGGRVIAQDEASSIVFGMPGAAVKAGLTDDVVALPGISAKLMDLVR